MAAHLFFYLRNGFFFLLRVTSVDLSHHTCRGIRTYAIFSSVQKFLKLGLSILTLKPSKVCYHQTFHLSNHALSIKDRPHHLHFKSPPRKKKSETYPAVEIIHEDSKVCQVITKTFRKGAVDYPRITSFPWPALTTKENSVNTFTFFFQTKHINYISGLSWLYVLIIIWLALRAGKMNQIARCDWLPKRARWSHLARSRLPAVSRMKNFSESYIINPLLTKFVRSRWLDIALVLFLRVYGPRLRLGP